MSFSGTAAVSAAPTKEDEDIADLISAHRYRLSITPPRQSSFRVVAILFYELSLSSSDEHEDVRHSVVGTNDEPCTISGSLCAERAALLQLRFIPNLRQITKVVIVTDSPQPISPGMLCREFMSSHPAIDPATLEIVLGSAVCGRCGLDVSGPDITSSSLGDLEGQCCSAHATEDTRQHDFRRTRTTLAELYPHPSPYVRLTAKEAEEVGSTYARRTSPSPEEDSLLQQLVTRGRFAADDVVEEDLDRDMHGGFYRSGNGRAKDESPSASSQGNGDEVLVLIDAAMGEEEEMPMVRRRHRKLYLSKLDAARYLLHLAQKVSQKDSRSALHPLRYGAAVLFSDGSTSLAYQKKALEYGCSLDAVTQLAQAIEDKGGESGDPRPVLLVQADQFGVLHAPYALGRAYLSEHGYGDCEIAVHGEHLEAIQGEEVSVVLVAVNHLTPSAPDIWANQDDE